MQFVRGFPNAADSSSAASMESSNVCNESGSWLSTSPSIWDGSQSSLENSGNNVSDASGTWLQPTPAHMPAGSWLQSTPAHMPAGSWLQSTPAHMPWGISQPSLVHFTGKPPAYLRNVHFKRKVEPEPEAMPACKLHITEEKMAAHMSELRISASTSPRATETEPMCAETTQQETTNEMKRLFLCDEMKRYNDEILPSAILCKLQKPSTALMLWQPPAGMLGQPLRDSVRLGQARRAAQQEEQEEGDNNNSSDLNLNSLVASGFNVCLTSTSSSSSSSAAAPVDMDL